MQVTRADARDRVAAGLSQKRVLRSQGDHVNVARGGWHVLGKFPCRRAGVRVCHGRARVNVGEGMAFTLRIGAEGSETVWPGQMQMTIRSLKDVVAEGFPMRSSG